MTHSTLLHVARRHLRWLLCFALLLPAAQWASAAHAFTHATEPAGRGVPEAGLHLQHCPICPVAAAVAAGGLASSAAGLGTVMRSDAGPMPAPAPCLVATALPRPANRGPPRLPA